MSTGVIPNQRNRRAAPRPSSAPIDPRLRERRIEVARGQGRKRLRRFVLLGALVVVTVGTVVVIQSPVLDVDRVAVSGAGRTGADDVQAAAAISRGRSMTSVDLGSAAARVERLPWIETATVTREWPGTVRISVVERTPVAVVGSGSEAVLVDLTGQALGPAGQTRDQPVVVGPSIAVGRQLAPVRAEAVAVVASLPVDLRREVDHVRATSSGLIITLDDGIRVRWGDRSQQTAKSDALRVLLDEANRSTIASIDVSVPAAATLRRSS